MDHKTAQGLSERATSAATDVKTATSQLSNAVREYEKAEAMFLAAVTRVQNTAGKTGPFGETEFKELCISIRHYGNLRYLIIPFFLALYAAPLVALKDGIKIDLSYWRHGGWLIPTVVGLIFINLERLLNAYIEGLVGYARTNWPLTFWGESVKRTKVAVTITIMGLYLVISLASAFYLWTALAPPPS
jgi:hypothetical protein